MHRLQLSKAMGLCSVGHTLLVFFSFHNNNNGRHTRRYIFVHDLIYGQN